MTEIEPKKWDHCTKRMTVALPPGPGMAKPGVLMKVDQISVRCIRDRHENNRHVFSVRDEIIERILP